MTTSAQAQQLITVSERPRNAETPLAALIHPVTPSDLFFIRSNFDVPVLDVDAWRLEVGGCVRTTRIFSIADLKQMPNRNVTATMECAGNGRKLMAPVPSGTAWDLGAVSTGEFTGVALGDVLDLCGIDDSCVEIAFEGADSGRVEGNRKIHFVRSLPLERALHPDTLIAWDLNGEPLALDHGYPVRVLVPGYYGVASVKWLIHITALAEPFEGHFQTERYIYTRHEGVADGTPVTHMHVRALIANPLHDAIITAPCTIAGAAWSGFGYIRRVDVSTDGGSTWSDATLAPPLSRYAATQWSFAWTPHDSGVCEIMARAEDSRGNTQPLEPIWNELGYGNNVVQRIRVNVA